MRCAAYLPSIADPARPTQTAARPAPCPDFCHAACRATGEPRGNRRMIGFAIRSLRCQNQQIGERYESASLFARRVRGGGFSGARAVLRRQSRRHLRQRATPLFRASRRFVDTDADADLQRRRQFRHVSPHLHSLDSPAPNAADFAIVGGTCTPSTTQLNANSPTCTVIVQFTPSTNGAESPRRFQGSCTQVNAVRRIHPLLQRQHRHYPVAGRARAGGGRHAASVSRSAPGHCAVRAVPADRRLLRGTQESPTRAKGARSSAHATA